MGKSVSVLAITISVYNINAYKHESKTESDDFMKAAIINEIQREFTKRKLLMHLEQAPELWSVSDFTQPQQKRHPTEGLDIDESEELPPYPGLHDSDSADSILREIHTDNVPEQLRKPISDFELDQRYDSDSEVESTAASFSESRAPELGPGNAWEVEGTADLCPELKSIAELFKEYEKIQILDIESKDFLKRFDDEMRSFISKDPDKTTECEFNWFYKMMQRQLVQYILKHRFVATDYPEIEGILARKYKYFQRVNTGSRRIELHPKMERFMEHAINWCSRAVDVSRSSTGYHDGMKYIVNEVLRFLDHETFWTKLRLGEQ